MMKRLVSVAVLMMLALCLIMAFAMVSAMPAHEDDNPPERGSQETIQPRVVDTIHFSVKGDCNLYTVSESNFLYKSDKVTVSGTWGDPYTIQVRLLKVDGSRAITVSLDINEAYTFTVPESGSYVIQVASTHDVRGTLSVNW